MPERAAPGPVLILTPTGADARVAAELLSERGIASEICADVDHLCGFALEEAGALIVAEEALLDTPLEPLLHRLGSQPPWSDIPLIVLVTSGGDHRPADHITAMFGSVGNITLLERPFRSATLISAVEVALRARAKQLEVRSLLVRERAALDLAREASSRARAAQAELEASEDRFRLAMNSIPQLAWMARSDGHIFWYNDRWYAYTGSTPGAMEGWGWRAVHDPAELSRVLKSWRASLASGEPWEDTFPLRRHDGQMRWHLSRALPHRGPGGAVLFWFGTNTDITEQRETLRALDESRSRLRLAVETAGIGLWSVTFPGEALELSDRCKGHLGCGPDETLSYADFLNRLHPQDRERVAGAVARALAQGGGYDESYRVIWPDASEHWIAAAGRAFCGEDGKPALMFGVTVDITAMKRGEAQREDMITAERAARAEAERVGRMKDEFLAVLSHELRTPLAAILGWTRVLLMTTGETERRGVEAIHRNALTQKQLIDDLLDMSAIVSGKLRLELGTVDLVRIAESAADAVAPLAQPKQVRIERRLGAGPAWVKGDAVRLQQVIWNLLSNAVKFSREGGDVRLEVLAEGDRWLCRVTDRGVGIAPAFLQHVFERFRQQDSSTRRRHGGLGLGLGIVKQLVEAHGGEVSAHSDGEGRGARFEVRLPVAAGPTQTFDGPATELAAGDPARDTLHGVHILLVDDDPDTREVAARILREQDAEVELARSVDEALERVRDRRPALVVSDIGMPGRDGYDLMEALRTADARSAEPIPAIALTAFVREDDRERALRAGYRAYLTKPIEAAPLVAACARHARR